MLAELAAANAAYSVIKEFINNGGEFMGVASACMDYFNNKSKIEKVAQDKGKGSEAFFAKEQLRKQEEELKNLIIYLGRPGLWDDWLQFQVDAKKEREKQAKELQEKKVKRNELIFNSFVWIGAALISITGVGLIGLIVWVASKSS